MLLDKKGQFIRHYKMPETDAEKESFNTNPLGWYKAQLNEAFHQDPLAHQVVRFCAAHGIKHDTRDFYAVLAFMGLMTAEAVTIDMAALRSTMVAHNAITLRISK
ncbi:MAG: hypothetical protein ABIL58_10405 [Pseudomonadota bacterium]